MKLQQRLMVLFKIMCFLSLAVNVLVYFILDSIKNEISFSVEAIFLVLIVATDGFDRAYIAILRKDFVILPTFIGFIIISSAIIVEAYKNISLFATVLIGLILIIELIVLAIVYFHNKKLLNGSTKK